MFCPSCFCSPENSDFYSVSELYFFYILEFPKKQYLSFVFARTSVLSHPKPVTLGQLKCSFICWGQQCCSVMRTAEKPKSPVGKIMGWSGYRIQSNHIVLGPHCTRLLTELNGKLFLRALFWLCWFLVLRILVVWRVY